jgi:hypothetical protein
MTLVVEGSTVGSVPGGIPSGGVQIVKEVSDVDSARLVAANAEKYGITVTNAETMAEVFERAFTVWCEQQCAEAVDIEKTKAARAAAAAVPPILVK